jgi:AraC-like DNA-binding protein
LTLDAGFGDLSTFNKTFRAAFFLTPTQYRASQL